MSDIVAKQVEKQYIYNTKIAAILKMRGITTTYVYRNFFNNCHKKNHILYIYIRIFNLSISEICCFLLES